MPPLDLTGIQQGGQQDGVTIAPSGTLNFGPGVGQMEVHGGGTLNFGPGGGPVSPVVPLGSFSGPTMSFLQSFPEMLGINPGPDVEQWRAQHPVGGFLTQLAGFAIPYAGEIKGLSMIPRVGRAFEAAEALGGENALLRGAYRAMAETGAVESTRLAVAATPVPALISQGLYGTDNSQGPLDMLPGSLLNVGLGGVLGGAWGGIAARLDRGVNVFDVVPDAAPDRPLVARLRALDDVIAAADSGERPIGPDILTMLKNEQGKLEQANLLGLEPQYSSNGQARISGSDVRTRFGLGRIINPLEGEAAPTTGRPLSERLNSLFSPEQPGAIVAKRTLTVGDTGFRSVDDLNTTLEAMGLNPALAARSFTDARIIDVQQGVGQPARTGQFASPAAPLPDIADMAASMDPRQAIGRRLMSTDPTELAPNTPTQLSSLSGADKQAAQLKNIYADRAWTAVDDGWHMAREADSGLWVAMKRIENVDPTGTARAGDKWAIVKTDNPDVLAPRAAKWRDAVLNKSAFWPGRMEFAENIGESTWDTANTYERQNRDWYSNMEKGRTPTKSALASFVRDQSDVAAAYLAPTSGLASANPRYAYIHDMMKWMEGMIHAKVGNLVEGARVIDTAKSPIHTAVGIGMPTSGGLRNAWQTLSKDALDEIKTVAEMSVKWEDVLALHGRGLIGDEALAVLRVRHQLFNIEFPGRVSALQQNLKVDAALHAIEGFEPLAGHYGFTRTRSGGFKALIEDEKGDIVGVASGQTARDARQFAQEIVDKGAESGKDYRIGGFLDESRDPGDVFARMKAAVLRPGFLRERGNLLGYEQSRGDWTAHQLIEDTQRNLRTRERLLANVVMQEKLWPYVQQLYRESEVLGRSAEKLLKRFQGDDGEFAKMQNAVADKLLGGVLGKDSATTIARTTGKVLSAFQFNFANIGQAVMQATDMLQTMLPEIAFQLSTHGRTLSGELHDTLPTLNAEGKVNGWFHALSPVKMFGKAVGMMFSPQAWEPEYRQFMNDLISFGMIEPRYAEEQFGNQGAVLKAGPKEAGYGKFLTAANELPIATVERVSRTMSATSAYLVGRELGLEGMELASFGRRFIERTNFSFGTADRPLVFTTPLGSMLGTFKTWLFHYMANMVKYATGGREALPALLWQTAMTGALAGGAGIPLFMPIANAASNWFNNKNFTQTVYDGLGHAGVPEWVSDGLLYGLPATLGVSLSTQTQAPGADPARDAQMLYSFAVMDRMKSLGGAVMGGFQQWRTTGASPFDNPGVRDQLIRALAPRTLYRGLAVSQDHALRSLNTGYRVLDNVSMGDALAYTMGFNPTRLEKAYDVYAQIRDDQALAKQTVSQLGEAMAYAEENGDNDEMTRIYYRATLLGLDPASVMRSADSRKRRMDKSQLENSASPEDRANYSWMFN